MNAIWLRVPCRVVVCTLALWLASPGPAAQTRSRAADETIPSRQGGAIRFEENAGQTDAAARFLARGPGYTLFLTGEDAVFALAVPRADPRPGPNPAGATSMPEPVDGRVIRMRHGGANSAPAISSGEELAGVSNYFLGDDPAGWRTGVRSFASVRYEAVYPGVDLVYYSRDGALEYDFVVAPGADPRQIELAFDGADSVAVGDDGALVVAAGPCELRHAAPVVYQPGRDAGVTVEGWYVPGPDNTVWFDLGPYDPTRELVIDPTLAYSTYLGGGLDEEPNDLAVDGWGNTYVVGYTSSANFPRIGAPWTFRGGYDAFVSVFGPAGMALLYSTYIGGTGDDYGSALALDAAGAVYLAGSTFSTNYPTMSPIETDVGNADLDAFVTKIAPTGASLVYSTYLGGDGRDGGSGIAVDAAGAAYVCGETRSANFPSVNPFQATNGGGPDAYVAKLVPAGTALSYATYLGGVGEDAARSIAVTPIGEAVVVGLTGSASFPLVNPFQNLFGGLHDAFVTKLAASGNVLRFSTFVGGDSEDVAAGVALDAEGAPVVVGNTYSTDFPTREPMWTDQRDGNFDGFVLKLAVSGGAMRFSTYLPGNEVDFAYDVAISADGRMHVVGGTSSTDFPRAEPLHNDPDGTEFDAFAVCLAPSGTGIVYSTYFGGTDYDFGVAVATDGSGNTYVAGPTESTDFPIESAYQSTYRGGEGDCFVAKIRNATADLMVSLTAEPEPVTTGQQLTYQLTVGNVGPNAAGEVIARLDVPVGTRYVSHSASQGNFVPPSSNGTGHFFAGRLPQGMAVQLRLDVRVEASGGAAVVNTATVTTTALDPIEANSTDSVTSHVVSSVVPPDIATVSSLVVSGKPYRIRITGTNFQVGVQVYIATDMEPWPKVKRKSETTLILKGAGLAQRFPRGVAVPIRVVNPDSGSDSTTFTR